MSVLTKIGKNARGKKTDDMPRCPHKGCEVLCTDAATLQIHLHNHRPWGQEAIA